MNVRTHALNKSEKGDGVFSSSTTSWTITTISYPRVTMFSSHRSFTLGQKVCNWPGKNAAIPSKGYLAAIYYVFVLEVQYGLMLKKKKKTLIPQSWVKK